MYCWRFRFKSHQRDYPFRSRTSTYWALSIKKRALFFIYLHALEQYTGFEPVPSAWKAEMLAIEHQYCIWHALRDLNPWHLRP